MRSSSSNTINIAASTQRLDVDNRIGLRLYYRIADNILRQADIFRTERNIIDLYVMLLRFSSLASETIPRHRDYRTSPQSKKESLKKKLIISMNELEKLKPLVQQKINELNSRHSYQQNEHGKFHSNNLMDFSPVKKQTVGSYGQIKTVRPTAMEFGYQGSRTQQFSYTRPVQQHLQRRSLNLTPAKEETRSKHSFLGPHGLNGHLRLPTSDKGVRYPSITDLSPVEIPSLQHSLEDGCCNKKDNSITENKRSDLDSNLAQSVECNTRHSEEPPSFISFEESEAPAQIGVKEAPSLISFEATKPPAQIEVVRQPSPPPVLAEVQDLVPAMSPHVDEAGCKADIPSSGGYVHAESPLQLHVVRANNILSIFNSTSMMENFMKLAKSNTDKNLETCGILAGLLKNRKFFITALIIPKQESTSDSCQATNEEEIFDVQDKQSLFPLGWIHTHPTQSCFMSSIDLHTHYSYQIMLPEAVAIVMAPRDSSRKHGIFRLTTPGGMNVIKQCQHRGFHPHSQPPDGGPIYNTCTDVYMNPDLKFDVIDLR
ncbi:AMSH-like ubiquitin thioesterase 1 isoform X1 [Arachis hypogaea]|uniref:AMSH-like ubiquitin thioesterase 1 isoform X1 n=1 Tax=Arachis hypogaea TaxID=3818 RepID=UPI000DECF766|nr:AMSH-like ubiquitin thioesterase 1 isoform X1 [Arachis hypogaea]